QRAITVAAAMATLDAVPHLDTVAHFADLGGGAGNIAMALAERWPQAQGEIVELTEPAEVARQHIADAGLSDRLRARTGKLAEGAPARGYDLIWCSSVLHFVPDLDACLADIYRALAPGGVFVSAHAEWPEATVSAQSHRVMSYYLPLRLRDCYVSGPGELLNRLKVAGFRHVSHWEVGSFPVAPLQVHAARKADR
ncbi:MAG TPA: hypothetical protein DD979_07270, partial [Gammaproteobacteria bacterium]|nr:hypothetical protein [Gammaproteobacteria bacterium]